MSSPSRRWVKVWHEILSDLDFQNLSLEQQARFYHLLVYTSSQGDNGKIEIDTPARFLVNLFQCPDYNHLKNCLIGLEKVGVLVTFCNAKVSVTFKYWSKYQVDTTSYERVKRFRDKQSVTPDVTPDETLHETQMITPQEKEKEKEKIKKEIKKKDIIRPENISNQVWEDFILHRKNKKAPVTQTVINSIKEEAGKAGITVEAALKECCIRGWQGFKADWYLNGGQNGTSRQPIKKQHEADRAAEALIRLSQGKGVGSLNQEDLSGY